MLIFKRLRQRLTVERLGWFGAGLSAAALGVLAYQVVTAAWQVAPLVIGVPGPRPPATLALGTPYPSDTPRPTRTPFPTDTPRPTRTPFPTDTPRPTRTPFPTDTPHPTRTPPPPPTATPTRVPFPTRTPAALPDVPDTLATVTAAQPDVLAGAVATLTLAEPDLLVGVVATFTARTSAALSVLDVTPVPRGESH